VAADEPDAIYNMILTEKEARNDLIVPVENAIDLGQDAMDVAVALNPRLERISRAIQNTFPNLPFILVLATDDGEVAVTSTSIDDFGVAAEILVDAAERLDTQMDEAVPLRKLH
jgi:hypothetical protein